MQSENLTQKPNSEIFLEVFTEIEKCLKEICSNDYAQTFSELLQRAKQKNHVVNHYAADLKEYAQLRNAIVHTRRRNFIIAEPHTEVVQEVIHIRNLLKNPPRVKEVMKTNPYHVASGTLVREVLDTLAQKGFMRCPVVDNGVVAGLITAKTMARWLVSGSIEIDSSHVGDLLNFVDPQDYCIVSESSDIVSLLGIFNSSVKNGAYMQAALVTKNGKSNSPLVGIITPSDFPSIIGHLKVKH